MGSLSDRVVRSRVFSGAAELHQSQTSRPPSNIRNPVDRPSAGAEHWSDGTYLAEHEDIVVVSVNYRLGALGGLAVDDTGTLGNNFLLDVVQALCWLQENVAAFGGNSERVTIAGESASAFIPR
ncbi:carboxylesterase family protein [Streptomyces sp. NPDC001027]|uniref:carboxylesterase family protein n=1 Tax=Streptomyces sp. NPDC001027 TaxID=3154771 RepID=UPI00331F5685